MIKLNQNKKQIRRKKEILIEKQMLPMKVENNFLNIFKKRKFPIKPTQRKGSLSDFACVAKVSDHLCLKILTPMKMLEGLSIALA